MCKNIAQMVIISDMDGTLLNGNKEISEVDKAAIEKFISDGGKFTAATGRTVQSFLPYCKLLDLQYPVILFNGSAVYDCKENKVLHSEAISKKAIGYVKEVLDIFPELGGEILTVAETIVFNNNEYEQRHIELTKVNPRYITPDSLDTAVTDDILKILFAAPPEIIDKTAEFIQKKNYQGVDFVRSTEYFFEMLPQGISKGSALKHYREFDNMKDCYFVAIGDYCNDIEILLEADLGAAPANASEEVKTVATLNLKNTNETGAVAELIDYLYKQCLSS